MSSIFSTASTQCKIQSQRITMANAVASGVRAKPASGSETGQISKHTESG